MFRQKTADQKSYCRYKGCSGMRGNFCGFCLGRRYGENVANVLVNPVNYKRSLVIILKYLFIFCIFFTF